MEVDVKHSSSFKYKKNLALVLTSNHPISAHSGSQVEVAALENRAKTLFLFVPWVREQSDQNRSSTIQRPKQKILPEVLLALYVDEFGEFDKLPDYNNEPLQTLPPGILDNFLMHVKQIDCPISKRSRLC